jgi:hypothetical protein
MYQPWLLAQLAATAALVGLCWTVQIGIYAHFSHLLSTAGLDAFRSYHAAYMRSIGFVAAPLMVAEAGLTSWACWAAPTSSATWAGAAALVLIWVLTFGLIVPVHTRLQVAPDSVTIARLNRLNTVRSALWTARVGLLLGLLIAN